MDAHSHSISLEDLALAGVLEPWRRSTIQSLPETHRQWSQPILEVYYIQILRNVPRPYHTIA